MTVARTATHQVTLDNVATPALILDRGIMESNIDRMLFRANRCGVALRPHMKTAKSQDVAIRATSGTKTRIAVSTLREAEYFAEHGFRDVLYAVSIVPEKIPRVARLLAAGCDVTVVLDDPIVAGDVARIASELGVVLNVMIELDCDGHRAGVAPEDPALLETGAALHSAPSVRLRGVIVHAGESYHSQSHDGLVSAAVRERDGALLAAQRLRRHGIPCDLVSIGSTPTANADIDLSGIQELRPGVFMFYDLFQAGVGVCRLQDIAVSVLATVVAHRPKLGRVIVDAGALALSKDRGTSEQRIDYGYGLVCGLEAGDIRPEYIVAAVSQEHGTITARNPADTNFDLFPIGTKVRILPNHACMTCAPHEKYVVVNRGIDVVDEWGKCSGW